MTKTLSDDDDNNNIEYRLNCKGICECYYDDKRRLAAGVIFSHRYSGMIIVSVLGLAVAKFVNDNIDECYERVRNMVSGDDDMKPIVCAMERDKQNCEVNEGLNEGKRLGKGERYECNGHCWSKKHFDMNLFKRSHFREYVRYVQEEHPCEDNFAGNQIVDVYSPKEGDYRSTAANIYRKKFLLPLCHSLYVRELWDTDMENPFKENMNYIAHPCTGRRRTDIDDSNIACSLVSQI